MKYLESTKPFDGGKGGHRGYSPLRANTLWAIAGNVSYLATQWLLLSIMAKSGGPDLVGIYSFALAVTAPLMMFAAMRQQLLQATDTTQRFSFAQYLGARGITVVFALLALAALTLMSSQDPQTRAVIWWVGIAKTVDLFSQTCQGFWQQSDRMDIVAFSRLLNGGTTMLVIGTGLWLSFSLPEIMFLSALVSFAVVVTYDFPWVVRFSTGSWPHQLSISAILRTLTPDVDPSTMRQLLILGFPLAIAQGLSSLDTNLPRLIIARLLDESALGVYSALAYTTLAGATLVNAIGNAVSPTMSRMFGTGDFSAIKRLIAKLAWGGAGLSALGLAIAALVGKPIVTLVYSSEFAKHTNLLLLLILGTGIQFSTTILTFAMTASRSLTSQAWVQILSLSLGTVCYYVFVSWLGLLGAGVAAVVMALFRLCVFTMLWNSQLRRLQAN